MERCHQHAANDAIAVCDACGKSICTGRTVATAAGLREAQLATVETLEVQGVRAGKVPVTISDELPFDGLLGLSFLGRFSMKIDQAAGTLELGARPATP